MFFRRNRPRQSYPPWLKWALLAFLAAAFLGHAPKHGTEGGHSPIGQAMKNLNPKAVLSDYKSKLFPDYSATLKLRDIAPGEGLPAVCGQQVAIAYETFANDKPVADKADTGAPLEFGIGAGAVMPALEQGVVGMRVGGERSVLAPPAMAYGIPKYHRDDVSPTLPVRFEITLLKATPPIPDADSAPFRISVTRGGSGPAAACGQPVKIHMTIWNLEGKKLFSTRDEGSPLQLTPGQSEEFLGLEQGVIGMQPGEMRTLIVPPAFQKAMDGTPASADFSLPHGQTVLVDVEMVP